MINQVCERRLTKMLTASFNIDDPSLPMLYAPTSISVESHPKVYDADAAETTNALLRESCWPSLDDDFYQLTASLLDDGAGASCGDEMSSSEGAAEDFSTYRLVSPTPFANENTIDKCSMAHVHNIIANSLGPINSQNQILSKAFTLEPTVHGTTTGVPANSPSPPFNLASAPASSAHYPSVNVQQQQQQQMALPFVMTAINKRLRLEPPLAAVPGSDGVFLFQDHSTGSDSEAKPAVEVQKTQAQKDRRRERNRIHARQTRLRNKTVVDSLHKEIMDLQRENAVLKALARTYLDEKQSQALLAGCDAMENLPISTVKACGANILHQVVTHVQMLKSHNCLGVTDNLQDRSAVTSKASHGYLAVMG